jgi:hypothetical protein
MLWNGWLDAHAPPDPMFFGSAPTHSVGRGEMISPMWPGGNRPLEIKQLPRGAKARQYRRAELLPFSALD